MANDLGMDIDFSASSSSSYSSWGESTYSVELAMSPECWYTSASDRVCIINPPNTAGLYNYSESMLKDLYYVNVSS